MFKLAEYSNSGDRFHALPFPIKNGTTLVYGELVRIVDGRAEIAVSGQPLAGVCIIAGTGDAAGSVITQVLPAQQFPFKIARGAIAAAALDAGSLIDFDATALLLSAAANNDFIVKKYNAETEEATVFSRIPQKLVA